MVPTARHNAWLQIPLYCTVFLFLSAGLAFPSHATMWVTAASPNNGDYTMSWNSNPLGCFWEDVDPPNGWYVEICNTLEEKVGSGGWSTVSGGSGTSVTFFGKSPNTYEYRLMVSWDEGTPTQAEWMQVVVSPGSPVTTSIRKCVPSQNNACDSAYALRLDANQSGIVSSLPYGSLILSSSQSLPVSAYLTVGHNMCCGKTAYPYMDNSGMIELDNRVYARAAEIPPFTVPPEYGDSASGADFEIVEGYIAGLL